MNAQRSSGTKFDLEERLLDYAVRIIRVTEKMKGSSGKKVDFLKT